MQSEATRTSWVTNPFFVYMLSFGGVFILYELGWSEVYPSLSEALRWFFAGTLCVAALMLLASQAQIARIDRHTPGVLSLWFIYPLSLSFCADLAANGGLPLVQNALGSFDRSVFDVGIPHLHPIIVTFGCTFSVVRFADFLTERRFRYLVEAIIPLVYLLLTLYRGPIFITLVSWAFVNLILRPITIRKAIAILAMFLAATTAFGAIGQMREGRGAISEIAHPSTSFEQLHLPEIALWPYIYATSPIANLELTLQRREPIALTTDQIMSEFLPDVISKRLMSKERPATAEVSKGLNVATMFGRSAAYDGYRGMIAIFLWFCFIIVVYVRLLPDFPLAAPSLAILNTIVVFSTFQNMIAYSGMSLQLVWPFLIVAIWRLTRKRTELNPTLAS